jgi:small ligand-binding sensory domain FIST
MTTQALDAPRFAAALSVEADAREAAREACRQARAELAATPNLAIAFVSGDYRDSFPELAAALHAELGAECLLGCTAESLVCGEREIEGTPALVIWLAHLPGVKLSPMHLEFARTADGHAIVGWPDDFVDSFPRDSHLLLLADPFTFPTDLLLTELNGQEPPLPVIGGMASGAMQPGDNGLLLGDSALDAGAVGVLVQGPIRIRTIVSQGCRPIGRPFVVTKAQDNVILELGGRPALGQLQELYEALAPGDQQLAQQGLHVGQVINEYQEQFGRGDFLIRNVQGIDRQAGAIAIGDYVRVGQTVQFHVRDAATADEDLGALLSGARQDLPTVPLGALLFTCNGRGTRLFDTPHHDAGALARWWNNLPVAGFFAQGEIGPVGGKSFLHGFTASIALFETPSLASPKD